MGKSFHYFRELFLVYLLFWFSVAISQPNDRWLAGSAFELKGQVQTLYCFIETPTDPWTPEEKDQMLSALNQAQEWLIVQATEWNTHLSFNTQVLVDGRSLVIPQIASGTGSGKERVDWVSEITKLAGYGNSKRAYRKLSKAFNNKNIYLIIFAHADGMSYAMRFAKGMKKKKYFLEGAILYQHYDNGTEMPLPAVIAHETLHMYGAWDLYTTYAQTPEKHAKAMEQYPNDIMLRVGNDLSVLKIDNLTAWLMGWNQDQEDIFEWFRPTDFRK